MTVKPIDPESVARAPVVDAGPDARGGDMVAPVFPALVLMQAQDLGVHLPPLFRGLEIDVEDFDTPGIWVSHGDAVTLLRRLLKRLPIGQRGLQLGRQARITERGALALGQLAAATLGAAMSLSVRFPSSAGHLLHVREEERADGCEMIVEARAGDRDLQSFLVDLTFAATVQWRRQLTLSNYTPARVELVCREPADAGDFAAFFGCPVHFGCARNVLVTASDWLAFRLPWAHVMACRLGLQLLEREASRFSAMPALGFTVERAIRRGLPAITGIAQLAASLHLSERTLRRQLAQAGLSFRNMLDESRRSRALDLMTTGSRPITDIAAATGFSDSRAFARAFRRWTGSAPSQFRTQLGGAVPEPAADTD